MWDTIFFAPIINSAGVGLVAALGYSRFVKSATAVLFTALKVEIISLNAALYSAAVGFAAAEAKEIDGMPTEWKKAQLLTDKPSKLSIIQPISAAFQ